MHMIRNSADTQGDMYRRKLYRCPLNTRYSRSITDQIGRNHKTVCKFVFISIHVFPHSCCSRLIVLHYFKPYLADFRFFVPYHCISRIPHSGSNLSVPEPRIGD